MWKHYQVTSRIQESFTKDKDEESRRRKAIEILKIVQKYLEGNDLLEELTMENVKKLQENHDDHNYRVKARKH
jgi:hypothetical protein